ncbi:MAG: hypothetical protein OWQ56_05835 [Acidithiobacillus caldus]|nr:hypothetical protein [Acidithiobacillus caldus]
MKDSQTKSDALESLQFLTPEERAELDMLLATMPTPLRIIRLIVRPDGSVEGYLVGTTEGYVELAPDDPLLKGYPPATPEQNGGYRPGERP